MSNACGNIKVDNTTLFWINNCLTASTDESVAPVSSSCEGIQIDSNFFKEIDNCITSVKATKAVEPMKVCGNITLDANFFVKSGNTFGFNKPKEEPTVPTDPSKPTDKSPQDKGQDTHPTENEGQ